MARTEWLKTAICISLLSGIVRSSVIQTETSVSSNGTETITRIDNGFSVRLTNGKQTRLYTYGTLEVSTDSNNALWQTVCDFHFSHDEGLTACRMFGFNKAEVIAGGRLNHGNEMLFLNKFACDGTEQRLADCNLLPFDDLDICDAETEAVALLCYTNAQDVLEMRLVDGIKTPTSQSGRLEVRIPPLAWGTVCDDMFNEAAATSACQYMGYKFGEIQSPPLTSSQAETLLDEVSCQKGQSFLECDHEIWGYHDCQPSEDIHIFCVNTTVRLLSAIETDYHVGSVEVHSEGEGWYEVCDRGWDDADAQVTCSELGFQSGKALCCNSLGSSAFGSIAIEGSAIDFRCTGSETELDSCPWTETQLCPIDGSVIQLAAVACYDTPLEEVNMTLSTDLISDPNGIQDSGILRIQRFGIWGVACDDFTLEGKTFTDKEASVACRMMNKGYTGGKRISVQAGQINSYHVWLRGISCQGDEASLEDCVVSAWGSPGLDECDDFVRVMCYKQELTLSFLRPNKTNGLLEITHDGTKGTVCADSWSDEEAHATCITMGYKDGKVWSAPSIEIPLNLPSAILSGVACGYESNLFMCESHGWGTPTQECETNPNPAGVTCYNNVKLDPGSHGKGIVKYLRDKTWYSICNVGFDDQDAAVVCVELGFADGKALPKGAFGFHRSTEERSEIACNGSETSIANCSYSTTLDGCNSFDTYASVSCYETIDEVPNDSLFLKDGYMDETQAAGLLISHQHNTDGYICRDYFTDEATQVACKQLGKSKGYTYAGGVIFSDQEEVEGPFFMGEPNCTGTEESLHDCSIIDRLCWQRSAVSVLCFQSESPRLEMESGQTNMHSGRLMMSINGQLGVICANGWDDNDASVACRQLSETYKRGVVKLFQRGTLPFYLSNIGCQGIETSIFECQNKGWLNIPTSLCRDGDTEAGVVCYTNVALVQGELTSETNSGILEIEVLSSTRYDVCFDEGFTHEYALRACSELGYSNAAFLTSVPPIDEYYMMKNIICKGDEISLSQCRYTIGYCSPNYGRVRLFCHQNSLSSINQWTIENQIHGRLSTGATDSYRGYSCQEQWRDLDAEHVCQDKGYRSGKALGSSPINPQQIGDNIIWLGPLVCESQTDSGQTCSFSYVPDRSCFDRGNAAGVLCYQDEGGIALRLMDHDNVAKYSGRVEIRYNSIWGSICNKNGGRLQARTVCKELGFEDGAVHTSSTFKRFGTGSGNIYLKDVKCSDSDESILGCPNAGWLENSNCTHDDDLEVTCFAKERHAPDAEKSYGAVSILRNGAYRLVCSDEFTDVEASVMCRSMGYVTGISICCSAFHVPSLDVGFKKINCEGTEESLSTCQTVVFGDSCVSGTHASVACSYSLENDIPVLSLANRTYGIIAIEYFNVKGSICTDNFNHHSASVICRGKGFSSGLGFSTDNPSGLSFIWPYNFTCGGSETFSECTDYNFGSTQLSCKDKSKVAYSVCLEDGDDVNIDVRLSGGGSARRGRLEVNIKGEWGTSCEVHQKQITDLSVNTVCRQLGYSGGRKVAPGRFGPGTGPVWLSGIDCDYSANKIKDCRLSTQRGTNNVCDSHSYDTSIECFLGAKLGEDATSQPQRGKLLVMNQASNDWEFVCDTGITAIEATVVCKGLGYNYGITQCCSADDLSEESIPITSISCTGQESDISACTIQRGGTCQSQNKAFVHCSNSPFAQPDVHVTSLSDFIGVPKVSHYGIEGYVCAAGMRDEEAQVLCREFGYFGGQILAPREKRAEEPVILSGLRCTGTESNIRDCQFSSLNEQPGCQEWEAAQILCTRSANPITFGLQKDNSVTSGRATIKIDDINYFVSIFGMDSNEATVFCNSIEGETYAYGELIQRRVTGTVNGSSLMTNVKCAAHATNFLMCDAIFLPKYSQVLAEDVAYITCHVGAELRFGGADHSGILTLYSKEQDDFGTVCNEGFGRMEADVACKMMNYEHGFIHCCSSFGFNYFGAKFKNMKCTGQEQSLLNCSYEIAEHNDDYMCSRQDYVGLTCYNGLQDDDFEVSLRGADTQSQIGLVQIKYMNIDGAICSDDWDDNDANVVCRELGFTTGQAYFHYKPYFTLQHTIGPLWISNVQCDGSESTLSQCPHAELGQVKTCGHGHYAGVLCSYGNEVVYRLAGTDQSFYGRVEVKINGVWGTICERYWDSKDAKTMCRQLGYVSGDVYETEALDIAQGPVYEIAPRCTGEENNLNECPHEGWIAGRTGSCANHLRDAGVFCYSSVRLSTGSGKTSNNGPVLIYENDEWFKVCDDGFNDISARKVCQDLGYYDGRSICCSAYEGESTSRETLHPNITLKCRGDEATIQDCMRHETCQSGLYASVICLDASDSYNDTDYQITLDEDFTGSGKLKVTHMGVSGRICSTDWNDVDARVFCRSRSFANGFAYYHSYEEDYVSASAIGPYWMSGVACDGTERSLSDCIFNTRKELGNCTNAHTASVICFQNDGIHYRLSGSPDEENKGRVEISVNNRWGSVCNLLWGNKDARVICRSLDYHDGDAQFDPLYGKGSGPIWLQNVQCTGNEPILHQCPHTGFRNKEASSSNFSLFTEPCSHHRNDASVFCYKYVKLNQGLRFSSGALLYYKDGSWTHVCDDTITRTEAQVICKSLMQGYQDGLPVKDGRFGEAVATIGINTISCTGSERSVAECAADPNGLCPSGKYASVACYRTPLTSQDFDFQIRLSNDSIQTSNNHGILEIRENGIWGRVCMKDFTDTEATVACRQLNFNGGVKYLHLFRNRLPMLWSGAKCRGTENSLTNCHIDRAVDSDNCPFDASEAGVVCYRNQGVVFRLSNTESGRVEIGVDGKFGTVCAINWNAANSKTLCRSLGYMDGIPMSTEDEGLESLSPMFSFFLCSGNESSLLSCLNSGFDEGRTSFLCGGDAYAACYNEEVKLTNIRLGDGQTHEGRVEVFVSGLEEWGTVCDDDWDDADASVVCRKLGFTDGEAIFEEKVKSGTGNILLDNVGCDGSESDLADCIHAGINSHNCDHSEDAGVRCFNVSVSAPPPRSSTASSTFSTSKTSTQRPVVTTSSVSSTTSSTTTTTPRVTSLKTEPPTTIAKTTKVPTTNAGSASITAQSKVTKPSITHGLSDKKKPTKSDESDKTVIIAACVTIAVAVVLIVVVIFLVYRFRSHLPLKSSIAHERFHNDVIEPTHDGSVAMQNQMYDLSNPVDDPITQYMADDSEIHLDRAGNATFSKNSNLTVGDEAEGFSNPLYSAVTEKNQPPNDDFTFSLDDENMKCESKS